MDGVIVLGKVEGLRREGRTSVSGRMRRGRCCGCVLSVVVGRRQEDTLYMYIKKVKALWGQERLHECAVRVRITLTFGSDIEIYWF